MLDDYGHLPFKRANNRFAKYRNASVVVIDDDGNAHRYSPDSPMLEPSSTTDLVVGEP